LRPEDLIVHGSKKSIHIKLLETTHTALRIQSFRYKISIQEMMEEFAQRIVVEDPVVMNMIKELADQKRRRDIRKLSTTDADTIYDMISEGNPLSERGDS
jgi:hypothetical protein